MRFSHVNVANRSHTLYAATVLLASLIALGLFIARSPRQASAQFDDLLLDLQIRVKDQHGAPIMYQGLGGTRPPGAPAGSQGFGYEIRVKWKNSISGDLKYSTIAIDNVAPALSILPAETAPFVLYQATAAGTAGMSCGTTTTFDDLVTAVTVDKNIVIGEVTYTLDDIEWEVYNDSTFPIVSGLLPREGCCPLPLNAAQSTWSGNFDISGSEDTQVATIVYDRPSPTTMLELSPVFEPYLVEDCASKAFADDAAYSAVNTPLDGWLIAFNATYSDGSKLSAIVNPSGGHVYPFGAICGLQIIESLPAGTDPVICSQFDGYKVELLVPWQNNSAPLTFLTYTTQHVPGELEYWRDAEVNDECAEVFDCVATTTGTLYYVDPYGGTFVVGPFRVPVFQP